MIALAYSPKFYLVNSYAAFYKIYCLKNPISNEIFYIGQTMKDLEERLDGHISDKDTNKPKCEYIQNLISQGNRPIIEAIETIKGTCYIDKMAVNEREIYWIKHYKAIGCNLLNIAATKPETKCQEYHNYLSAIKKGESSYHYYLCGKTTSGIPVYDEERLIADGFGMPREMKVDNSNHHHYYDPWQNERFLKMIGRGSYRNDGAITYDYEAFKDLDPEYYEQENCILF
jgi:hypothetical protein